MIGEVLFDGGRIPCWETGSALILGKEHARDYDVVCLVPENRRWAGRDEFSPLFPVPEGKELDCHPNTMESLKEAEEKAFVPPYTTFAIRALMYDFRHFGNDDFPARFDFLRHRDRIPAFVLGAMRSHAFGFHRRITADGRNIGKMPYYLHYVLCAYEDGTSVVKGKHLEELRMIHDGRMPLSFLNEMKGRAEALFRA